MTGMMYSIIFICGFGSIPIWPTLLRPYIESPMMTGMTYMMPVMMTVMFLNFASGLNLYYAVQNIASIPQQWMLAKERKKMGLVKTVEVSRSKSK